MELVGIFHVLAARLDDQNIYTGVLGKTVRDDSSTSTGFTNASASASTGECRRFYSHPTTI